MGKRRWIIAASALALGVVGALMTPVLTAEPTMAKRENADRLNAFADKAQPAGEDAVPLLREVAAHYSALDSEWQGKGGGREALHTDLEPLLFGEWGDPRQTMAYEAWESAKQRLPEIHRAAEAPAFRWSFEAGTEPGEAFSVDALSAHMELRLRHFGQLLRIELREKANAGDWEGAAAALSAGIRLGVLESRQPTMMARLLCGYSVAAMLAELRQLSLEIPIPASASATLIAAINREAGRVAPSDFTLEGERLFGLASLDECFDSEGRELTWRMDREKEGDDFAAWADLMFSRTEPPTIMERIKNICTLWRPRRADAERALNAFYDDLKAWIARPAEATPAPVNFSETARSHPVFKSLSRLIPNSVDTMRLERSEPAATVVALRLAEFHTREGRWPRTLSEAMTPEQALDPATGAPFVYRLRSGEPDDRAFSLRSAAKRVMRSVFANSAPDPNEGEFVQLRGVIDDKSFPHLKKQREFDPDSKDEPGSDPPDEPEPREER